MKYLAAVLALAVFFPASARRPDQGMVKGAACPHANRDISHTTDSHYKLLERLRGKEESPQIIRRGTRGKR